MTASRLLVAALLACAGLLIAAPAEAVVYTSTGVRCTVVGTAGSDDLTGSGSRDVICGRGGEDIIMARGGNDLVDGGLGVDTVDGGAGDDRLIGGGAADELSGGTGEDTLMGGDGGDDLFGAAGDDVLGGQDGNDDLIGGDGADSIHGGAGTNWCSMDPADVMNRCVHDAEKPVAHELELSSESVDVSDSDAFVTLQMHLTDDTGITSVQLGLYRVGSGTSGGGGNAELVDGTVRDGTWAATVLVPRWLEPGDYQVLATMRDRVRRSADRQWTTPDLNVINDNPDLTGPVVADLAAPRPGFVADVRGTSQTVHMRARVTDTQSGVKSSSLCLMRPTSSGGYTNLPCAPGELVSGTRNDGWWEGDVVIPRGSVGGDWNVSIWVEDRAHPGETHFWMGPDDYRVSTEGGVVEPRYHELPDGSGRFQVLGATDSYAPELTDLTATPNAVDTLSGPQTVLVRVHAVDVEGVTNVGAWLHSPEVATDSGAPEFLIENFTLVDGTEQDGTWAAELQLPQGTPPGDYFFQAWVEDVSHSRSWVSAGSPYAGEPNQQMMAWDPKVIVQQAP